MTIPIFDDGYRLKVVREQSLNPLIDKVNELDPKVKGLQTVVALSMTEPSVDVDGKRITFKKGGEGATLSLDLGPMFDSYQHGIGISGPTGGTIPDIEKIMFKNLTVRNTGNKSVEVTAPEVTGQVGSTNAKTITRLNIEGNTAGSSVDANGVMTLNMPNNSIKSSVNGDYLSNVDKVRVIDTSKASKIENDTLFVQIPDPIKGSIQGGGDFPLKSIKFQGNVGTSTEGSGDFIIELPGQEVDPGDGTFETYHKIRLKGNIGASQVVSEVLEIDLPAGGGGGTGGVELKVGEKNSTPVPNVSEIYFEGSTVKVDTTRSTNKVLVTPKGFPVEIDGSSEPAKNVKQIKLTGDVETSNVSDTGLLTLNIPHHEGLSVSDGATISKGITTLTFKESDVVIDSSAAAKATITPKGVTGILDGKTEAVKEIEIVGTLGASTLANGKLKIDLPAGGGGTGGADITGIVGSQSAKIDRIEVIGANTYNSSVAGSTLKVDIPRKPAIRGGTDQFSDIDIVEVANSTVTLDTAGGSRKALITPHIPFMGEGWFPTIEAMNAYIPEAARIPTKTYGYITNAVTGETSMWIWMPDLTGGGLAPNWVEMPISGSLSLMENNHRKRGVLAVKQNPMVTIDGVGQLTITDTTVPEVICETLSSDGTSTLKSGKFNELRFEDGEGVVDFDISALDLKVYRAQRRLALGNDPDTSSPRFMDDKYEGSLWLNKTDNSWWGYNNKDAAPGTKKWTKVLHRGMSDDVANLSKRVPQVLPSLDVATETGDDKAWAESGWTHLPQGSMALPAETRQKTGGYVETFVISDPSVTGNYHRYQMLHVETDAATYKRFWKFDEKKWSDWVKTSFNPLELKAHNNDPTAHRATNPFFRAFSFGTSYPALAGDAKGPFKHVIEKQECRMIGTSGGSYSMTPGGDYIKAPYKGNFDIRGLAYIGGRSDLGAKSTGGDWTVELQKCEASSSTYNTILTQTYQHHSTTLKYPPFSFKFVNVALEQGDFLRLKIQFKPSTGTEATFMTEYKDLWIMPGRSYFAIDEVGNDTGYAIAKGMSDMFGGFSALGGGAFGYTTGVWPADKGNIVGDGIEDPVYCV